MIFEILLTQIAENNAISFSKSCSNHQDDCSLFPEVIIKFREIITDCACFRGRIAEKSSKSRLKITLLLKKISVNGAAPPYSSNKLSYLISNVSDVIILFKFIGFYTQNLISLLLMPQQAIHLHQIRIMINCNETMFRSEISSGGLENHVRRLRDEFKGVNPFERSTKTTNLSRITNTITRSIFCFL